VDSVHGGKKNSTIDNENETQKYFLVFASFFFVFVEAQETTPQKKRNNKTEDGVIPGNSFQNTEELPKQLIKDTILHKTNRYGLRGVIYKTDSRALYDKDYKGIEFVETTG
jgi:hypothetical protein